MSASIRDLKRMLYKAGKRGDLPRTRLLLAELVRKTTLHVAKIFEAREREKALRQARLEESQRAWQARHEKYMDEKPLEKLYEDELR